MFDMIAGAARVCDSGPDGWREGYDGFLMAVVA